MGDIVKSLRFLEFPECTKQALKFLATALSSSSAGDGKYIADVCQDYILFRRTSHRKQLNAIQELQLLELLCGFLEGLADGVRTAAFAFIFGGRINTSKVELLTKLVSMGISVQSKPVLDSVADWMQDHGCDSEHVLNVTRTLIEDHCRLFPDTTCAFRSLPSISPLLACNLMCAVTSLYRYHDVSGSPPGVLVEYVTDWIITDPALCAASLLTFSSPHMMAEGSERHCPLTGLLRWCAFGPLVEKSHLKGANSESCNILTVFSKLHLALLQTLLSFYHEHCQLLTLKNIELLVRDFALVSKNQDEDSRQFAIERLAQAFQVGISSGNLRCSPRELSLVVQSLMPNRLLNSVVNQGSTQNAVPMEVT